MKDDFTILLPDDASDPDALWKQWSMFSPSIWDGYVVDDFVLPRGTDPIYSPKDLAVDKCECGAHKTYGELCPVEFHSSWCKLHA